MKTTFKYIGFGLIGLILLFLFVANFSARETNFQCIGEISYEANTRPLTVYMRLTEYRPWVNLWNDSDGTINLEAQAELRLFEYYGHIDQSGDLLHIYETYPNKALRGNFSKLSKKLAIDLGSPFGFFEGNCAVIN